MAKLNLNQKDLLHAGFQLLLQSSHDNFIVSVPNKQHSIVSVRELILEKRIVCVCVLPHNRPHLLEDTWHMTRFYRPRTDGTYGLILQWNSWSTLGFIPSWPNLENLQGLWRRCPNHHSRLPCDMKVTDTLNVAHFSFVLHEENNKKKLMAMD